MSEAMILEEQRIADQRARDEARLVTMVLQRPLRELPTLAPAVTCERNTPVREAVEIMQQRRIGCMLVVDQGQLIGVFTERDVLTKVAACAIDIDHTQVEALMTPKPECLGLDNELVYALNQMSIGGYRHIPLVRSSSRDSAATC